MSSSERLQRAVQRFGTSAISVQPVITIITVTCSKQWFADLAISILEQSFTGWEWCILDDGSSDDQAFGSQLEQLRTLPNIRIASLDHSLDTSRFNNEGLRLASGRYVCFVDDGDVLAPDALLRCVESLESGNSAVYTDCDEIDETGNRTRPFYKPDWSPEFFRGAMYVGHLLAVSRDIALAIGGFDGDYAAVQDFEFLLRYSEVAPSIAHIPEVLYHRRLSNSNGDLDQLPRKAVNAQLERLQLPAIAEYGDLPHRLKIIPSRRQTFPKVSIIIPTRDGPEVLRKCLYSLFSKTTYPNFEILCVDNETTDARALEEMRSAPVRRILFTGRFNFSKANNLARKYSAGEYLVFLNNDVEVVSPDWIEQMIYYAEQSDVGAVGPLLLYPDRTVQHAGVVLGGKGIAEHVSRGAPGNSDGYAGSLSCAREVSAVTAACLMMRRSQFDEIGGFNEHFFTAYQDVDLCLKIRKKGMRIIYTPLATLIHDESTSRGTYYDMVDHHLLLDSWGSLIKAGDPYYNRNFNLESCDYTELPRKPS